jgi:hypothetical protein
MGDMKKDQDALLPKRERCRSRYSNVRGQAFANATKRDDEPKTKWEGRGTSGEEMAEKERRDSSSKSSMTQ